MPSPLKEYRSKIKKVLINNIELAELILNREIDADSFDADIQSELDEHIFSFAFIPDFQGKANTFITFELSSKNNKGTGLYRNMALFFFIFTHHSLINPKTTHGQYTRYLRTDLIDEIILDLFNENLNFGCGKMKCVSDEFLKVNNDYYGRQLRFEVSDLAKKVC